MKRTKCKMLQEHESELNARDVTLVLKWQGAEGGKNVESMCTHSVPWASSLLTAALFGKKEREVDRMNESESNAR